MEIILIQQPNIVNFSGNPVPYSMAVAPYGILERKQDLRIKVVVEMEVADQADNYREIHEQTFFPDANGQTALDIASIAQSYLSYYVPRYTLNAVVKCTGQSQKFRLKILLSKDGILVGDALYTDAVNIIHGGMPYEHWSPASFFNYLLTEKKPLHYYTGKEMVGLTDKKYMYFLWPERSDASVPFQPYMVVNVTFHLASGGELPFIFLSVPYPDLHKVYAFPIGLQDLKDLSPFVPDEFATDVVKYVINVEEYDQFFQRFVISDTTFWVDHRNFYNPARIIFTNSLGGMDTIRLLGEIDYSADFTNSLAKVTVPPSGYINGLLQSQDRELDTERTEKFSGATDFVSKEKLMLLTDVLTASVKLEQKSDKFIPVLINKKNVKFYNSKDSLQAMIIEWQHAFTNKFFGLQIPENTTCPGLRMFNVLQVNKTTLQILWSCPMPYDQVEIEITNGTPADTITFQLAGNSGSETVQFTNPAAPGATAPITIKARIICNQNVVPVDYGPYSTKLLTAQGNMPPIANNDILVIAAGYNTAQVLTGNLLSNDYDTDGDALECVVATGATVKGGVYALSAAGVVTYTPPNSTFNGVDEFTYTCREVANPASSANAKCFVQIGNIVLGSSIYVKIIERNHYLNITYSGSTTRSGGSFFLTFWADPAATIPKDLTGLGITVNVETENFSIIPIGSPSIVWVSVGVTTAAVAATGVEQLFYNGETLFTLNFIGWQGNKKEFTLLPGTGYIPI